MFLKISLRYLKFIWRGFSQQFHTLKNKYVSIWTSKILSVSTLCPNIPEIQA